MKYRVSTDNGDTLFYGLHRAKHRRYYGWNTVTFYGSPQQHVELTRHLNRHSSSWIFEDNRNQFEGEVVYHLPPYFNVEEVFEDTPETDAAVRNVESTVLAIIEPTFPAPHAEDPYTEVIDVNYAYEGERFRAEFTRWDGSKQIRYGTFAMDGNAVSPNYGWLTLEAEGRVPLANAKIRAYGPDSDNQYINVRFDDRPEDYYQSFSRPNETLYPGQVGLVIYGLPEVARRKKKLIQQTELDRKRRTGEARLEAAKAELAAAEEALKNLK